MKFAGYINGALIINIAFTLLLFVGFYDYRNNVVTISLNFLSTIDSIVRMVVITFSGVLLARLIIDEYNEKTITLMFAYLISRKWH